VKVTVENKRGPVMADAKVLEVRNHGTTMMKEVKWTNGGEVPKELAGVYTNARIAQEAIDYYMANRRKPKTSG